MVQRKNGKILILVKFLPIDKISWLNYIYVIIRRFRSGIKHANMICSPVFTRIFVILISTNLLFSSCSTTRIVTKYDCNTIANNPVNKKTTWAYAWGLVQPKDIDPKCDAGFNHLNRVTVKTNLGYILLSVVTLGIVIPQQVEWCCAPPDVKPETLGKP